jgi:hypothetical protein
MLTRLLAGLNRLFRSICDGGNMKFFRQVIASILACGMTVFTPLAYGAATKESDKLMEKGLMIPTGTIMPFAGSVAPAGWVLAYGQEVSQTSATYAILYGIIGSTYCTTDHGGTCTGGNFRIPDLRGRVLGGKDNMGGSAASRMASNITGSTLGAAGGGESYTPSGTIPGHYHTVGTGSSLTAAGQTLSITNKSLNSGSAAGQTLSTTNVSLASGSAGGHTLSTTNVSLASGSAAGQSYTGSDSSGNPLRTQGGGYYQSYATTTGTGYYWITATEKAQYSAGIIYPNLTHTHGASSVTGTTDIAHTHGATTVTGTTDIAHTHAATTVTGTTDIAHTHSSSNVTGQTDIQHSHGTSSVTGTIGKVTGGSDGDAGTLALSGTSGNNLAPTVIINYIIKL